MASVRIEAKAWNDWRVSALAKLAGVDVFGMVGRLAKVWEFCTEHQTYNASPRALATITEIDNFAQLMCECELGELQDDGSVRVRGTAGRIEWLGKRRGAAAVGGKKSGKSRRRTSEANAKQTRSKREAKNGFASDETNPLVPALVPAPALVTSESESQLSAAPPRAVSQEAADTSGYLLEAIRSHSPEFAGKAEAWEKDLDLAIRRDGRTPEGLRTAIDFAHRSQDLFWRANILSGKKLREKYETLRIQAGRAPPRQQQLGGYMRVTGAELYANGEVKL